jgi:hypothetical protein
MDDKLSTNVSRDCSTPYFFSRDRLIVLYVGTDESTLETLTGILSPDRSERAEETAEKAACCT